MTPVEKALIVPQCERRLFSPLSFTFLLFLCVGRKGGRGASMNRLMCSIQQTLYTGSIKQESALCSGTIVPFRTDKKGLVQDSPGKWKEKKSSQQHLSGERWRKLRKSHVQCRRERGLDSCTQLGFNAAEVVPAAGLWLCCFESKIQM